MILFNHSQGFKALLPHIAVREKGECALTLV